MLWLLNRYVLAGIGVLALLVLVYFKGVSHGKASVQAKWDSEKAAQIIALDAAKDKIRQAERQLQANADKARKEKDYEIGRIKRNYDSIVAGLRQRASRSDVKLSSGSGNSESGCTGAQLSREDAEFLVGEAARADQLSAELIACYATYDDVRNKINAQTDHAIK